VGTSTPRAAKCKAASAEADSPTRWPPKPGLDPRPNDSPASGWTVLAGLVVGVGIAQVLALAGEGFPGVPGPDPG